MSSYSTEKILPPGHREVVTWEPVETPQAIDETASAEILEHEKWAKMQIFFKSEFQEAMRATNANLDQAKKELLAKWIRKEEWQDYPIPVHFDRRRLDKKFPNFKEATDYIAGQVALARVGEVGMCMRPLIMLGDAGIGKTRYVEELARELELPFSVFSAGMNTGSWELTGHASSWHGATQGIVARSIMKAPVANPIILVDEIEKMGSNGGNAGNGQNSMLALLERTTAARFEDEYLGVAINASYVNWFMTANNINSLSEPFRSRCKIVKINAPSPDQMAPIAQSVYSDIRKREGWGGFFAPKMKADALESLLKFAKTPRDVAIMLNEAFGQAALEGRKNLAPNHFKERDKKTTIGFTRNP